MRTTATAHLPPGPRGHWLTGSLGELRRDRVGFYERLAREYGDVVAFRAGPFRFVLVSRPDLIEQVLVTDNRKFHKNDLLQLLRPALGNGLLLSEGDVWLRQRRLAQPAFHADRVARYGALMVDYSARMTDRWQDGETRDIHRDLMGLTMDIVAKVLFGADMDGRELEVGAAIEDLLEGFASSSSSLPLPEWIPTPGHRRTRRAVSRLDELIAPIIAARRSSPGDGDDLLAMLMAARDEDGRPMSDRQLRDEVATLFAAGHETTAVALSWTFMLLGRNPDAEANAPCRDRPGPGRASTDGRRPVGAAVHGRGRAGVDAPLSTGVGDRPQGARGRGARWLPDPEGHEPLDEPVGRPPRRPQLRSAARVRPRPMARRPGRSAAANSRGSRSAAASGCASAPRSR